MAGVYSCRWRAWSPQVILCVLTCLSFVLVSFFLTGERKRDAREWRQNQLLHYEIPEISIEYIRKFGHVDHKIEKLSDDAIDAMNETDLMVTVHSFLDNADSLCRRRIRMGYMGDGGWEICDDKGLRPRTPPCLVYSFGVVEDYAFEDDAARIYKCDVHAFNPNLRGTDFNNGSVRNVYVHPFGIGRYSEITASGKELFTLADIRSTLGHSNQDIDVIKIDIEGSEWPVLTHMLDTDQLDNVRQLLVEFHLGFPPNEFKLRRAVKILGSLSKLGFRKFYVHKNPRGSFHHPNFPVVRAKNYEVHYINVKFRPDLE